ncbi:MAG: hypothetical protein HY810_00750 [Candidatus Omnitrophica bacterium]|nr:hypothetical protein [Candidatus Omnitrophota bacterium]
MTKNLITLTLLSSLFIGLTGCASLNARINRISINMHKDEVRALMGNNFKALASKVDKEGRVLDLWEIYDEKTKKQYVIYFLNNRVSQWGNKEELQNFPELHSSKLNP